VNLSFFITRYIDVCNGTQNNFTSYSNNMELVFVTSFNSTSTLDDEKLYVSIEHVRDELVTGAFD
jgi:hypothetical protein